MIALCAWLVRDLDHNAGSTGARVVSFQHSAIYCDTSARNLASSPRQNAPFAEPCLLARRHETSTLRRASARARGENLRRNKKGARRYRSRIWSFFPFSFFIFFCILGASGFRSFPPFSFSDSVPPAHGYLAAKTNVRSQAAF